MAAKDTNVIEFVDTHSLYSTSDPIWVTFSYQSNYTVSEKDRIRIYKRGETDIKKYLAEAQIGDPGDHWLFDSDHERSGKVFLDVTSLPPGDQLQLWYVSGHEVLGKSKLFSLTSSTSQSPNFPQNYDSGSRPQSGQLSSIGSASQFGSSFTNVSSNQLSSEFIDVGLPLCGSTSAEFVDIGEPSQPISEFVHEQLHSQLDSSFTMVTEGKSFKQVSSEYEIVDSHTTEQTKKKNDQNPAADDQLLLIEPLQSEENEVVESCDAQHDIDHRPIPVPRGIKQKHTLIALEKSDVLINLEEVVEQPSPTPVLSSTGSKLVPSKAGLESSSELPLSPAYEVDMSASAVFVDQFTSQKEAKVLKNNNKELRQKIKKLTKHLEDMRCEKQTLELQLAEGNLRNSALSELESELKQANLSVEKMIKQVRQLTSENESLKEKISVLKSDCKTQNDRNGKLLSKIQECETQSTVLASENAVLKVKVHQLEEQLHKAKRKEHRKREAERPSSGNRETHEPKEYKNHHVATSKKTQRDHHASKPKFHESGTRASEQILQEVKPKPRPHHHHNHRVILDDPNPSKPEEKQPPKTSRPTELPLGGGQPTPAPRHSKSNRKEPGAFESQNLLLRETKQPEASQIMPVKTEGDNINSLSETRIQEIVSQLRGEELGEIKPSSPVAECPICGKQLVARENEYGVQLHVEQCLAKQST